MRWIAMVGLLALAACSAPSGPDVAERRAPQAVDLPPMNVFGPTEVVQPTRSNASIAGDVLDLTFRLESGRVLPVLTRFEGPITVRVTGDAPRTLNFELDRLIARIRREARIDIRRVAPSEPASITVEVLRRAELQRAVPQAACFVAPRVTSWTEFKRNRRSEVLDWATLETRERMSVFLPGDVSPQEVRDCLHEEIAQAIGPLNDLYRLADSVFNDDNFHTVLTGFDMLVLRAIYAPELRSGMTREQVAARLPAILDRLNPAGRGGSARVAEVATMEAALDPRGTDRQRLAAARRAVEYAFDREWNDNRLGYSLYTLGRLSMADDPQFALATLLQAGGFYASGPGLELQEAHVSAQLAAYALTAGQADAALEIVNRNLPAVARAQKADLLATLLLIKAEALELEGRASEARSVRLDSLGWARYGFGSDGEVRARAAEISALSPLARGGERS